MQYYIIYFIYLARKLAVRDHIRFTGDSQLTTRARGRL